MVQNYSKELVRTFGDRTFKMFKNVALSPLKAGEIGFNVGEYNNLSSNFLIALHRYGRQNKKTLLEILNSPKDMDLVHGNMRALGLNMSETGQFAWQKGYLSWALQFQGINFKTGLALIGKNQAFIYYPDGRAYI